MEKINKFSKSVFFISIWLMISSYLINIWNAFHWEYIYLNLRSLFNNEFWFVLERNLFGFDVGYWLEELLKYLSYEIPKETLKYLPIYFFLRSIWIKKISQKIKK